MAILKDLIVNGAARIIGDAYLANVTATKFVKDGVTSTNLLQAGGGDIAFTWSNLGSKPSWIGSSKPTYTLDDVNDGSNRKLADYLPLSGGILKSKGYISFTTAEADNYDPDFGITLNNILGKGNINIAANTNGNGTEYVIITSGYSKANSTTANGLAIGFDTLTWKNYAILNSNNYTSYAANKLTLAETDYTQSSGAITVTLANLRTALGTLPVANGGTGLTSISIYSLLYASANNTLHALAPNIENTKKFLRMQGTGSAGDVPNWDTVTKSDVGLSNVENTKLSTWTGSSNITTLGTISSGTWNGTTIAVNKGGTNKTSWTKYGILYASETNALSQITVPTWGASTTYWLKCVTNSSKEPTYSLNTIDDLKTTLGLGSNAYTSTSYLPLTGGKLSLDEIGSFTIYKNSNEIGLIKFTYNNSNTETLMGYLGINGVNNPVFAEIASNGTSVYSYRTLLHAGNYTSYGDERYLKLTGGTMSANAANALYVLIILRKRKYEDDPHTTSIKFQSILENNDPIELGRIGFYDNTKNGAFVYNPVDNNYYTIRHTGNTFNRNIRIGGADYTFYGPNSNLVNADDIYIKQLDKNYYDLSDTNHTELTATDNIDDFLTPGIYSTSGRSRGSTVKDSIAQNSTLPTFSGGFRLYVEKLNHTTDYYIKQTISTYAGLLFYRNYIDNDWTEWNLLSNLFTTFSGGSISSSGNTLTQANHSITIGDTTKTAGSSTATIINSNSLTGSTSKSTSTSTYNLSLTSTVNGVVSTKSITKLWSSYIDLQDIRGTDWAPNHDNYPAKSIVAWFNQTGVPSSNWYSGITVKGWINDYASWQLAGYSGSNTTTDDNLYFRNGINGTWNAWRTILDSNNSSVSSTANSITVKINGTTATLTNTNTDTCVIQSKTDTSNWRPVILGYQKASKNDASLYTTVTNVVYTTNVLQYQPSTGLLSSTRLDLTQATGTAPMTIASTTKVDNLNADLLDGKHASDFITNDRLYTEKSNPKLSTAGWYRVLNITAYAFDILMSVGGTYNNANPGQSTFIISIGYNNGKITQLSNPALMPYISKIRLVRYASGKHYIDVYYDKSSENTPRLTFKNLGLWKYDTTLELVAWTAKSETLESGEELDASIIVSHSVNTILDNLYTSRQASMNVSFGDGSLRVFKATSSTTTGKPASDAHILHLAWDNSGYDAQIAVRTGGSGMQHRGQNAGTWSDWKTLLDSSNYTTYTVKKDGTGASGTWDIGINGNAATATNSSILNPVYYNTSFFTSGDCPIPIGSIISGTPSNASTTNAIRYWDDTLRYNPVTKVLTAGTFNGIFSGNYINVATDTDLYFTMNGATSSNSNFIMEHAGTGSYPTFYAPNGGYLGKSTKSWNDAYLATAHFGTQGSSSTTGYGYAYFYNNSKSTATTTLLSNTNTSSITVKLPYSTGTLALLSDMLGYCETVSNTAAKLVHCNGYKLRTHNVVYVLFANDNTSQSDLTLNVNGTGAKTLYINDNPVDSSNYNFKAGTYLIYYDGTRYYLRNNEYIIQSCVKSLYATKLNTIANTSSNTNNYLTFVDSNNSTADAETVYTSPDLTYNPSTKTLSINGTEVLNTYITCTTSSNVKDKIGKTSAFTLKSGSIYNVLLLNDNTNANTLTLNINNTGSKTIHINGQVSSSTNYILPKGLYEVYYDGVGYYFSTMASRIGGTFGAVRGTTGNIVNFFGDGKAIYFTYKQNETGWPMNSSPKIIQEVSSVNAGSYNIKSPGGTYGIAFRNIANTTQNFLITGIEFYGKVGTQTLNFTDEVINETYEISPNTYSVLTFSVANIDVIRTLSSSSSIEITLKIKCTANSNIYYYKSGYYDTSTNQFTDDYIAITSFKAIDGMYLCKNGLLRIKDSNNWGQLNINDDFSISYTKCINGTITKTTLVS